MARNRVILFANSTDMAHSVSTYHFGDSKVYIRASARLMEDNNYRARYANKAGYKFGFKLTKNKTGGVCSRCKEKHYLDWLNSKFECCYCAAYK